MFLEPANNISHDIYIFFYSLQAKALGKVLFEQVCRQLNLLEADYFGLEYQETGSSIKVHSCFIKTLAHE